MVDVQYLQHLLDVQNDPLDIGQVRCFQTRHTKKNAPLHASRALMVVLPGLDHP